MPLSSLVALAAIAAAMALIIARLAKWASEVRLRTQAAVVGFLLAMMAAMFLGALIYVVHPGTQSLVEGLWIGSVAMSLSVFPLFFLFLEAARGPSPGPALASRRGFVALAIALVLGNELLMGATFQIATGPLGPTPGPSWLGAVGGVVVSPWFLLPMALEMGATAVWLWPRFPRAMRSALVVQPVVMLASPPAFGLPAWVLGTAAASAIAMTAYVVDLLALAYRGEAPTPPVAAYAVRLVAALAAMGGGIALWAWTGNADLFAVAVLADMVLFFTAVLDPERHGAPVRSASPDPAPGRATVPAAREPAP